MTADASAAEEGRGAIGGLLSTASDAPRTEGWGWSAGGGPAALGVAVVVIVMKGIYGGKALHQPLDICLDICLSFPSSLPLLVL